MRLMDSAWDEITLPDVISCWIRSQYLPPEHVDRVKCIANDTEGFHPESAVVGEAEAVQLASRYELVHFSPLLSTPLLELVNDFSVSGRRTPCSKSSMVRDLISRGSRIP